MRDTPDTFFSKESVPEGFSWVDPSHMQKDQMSLLLDHWLGRQEEGHVGLQFTGCPHTNFKRNDYRSKTRESPENDEEDSGKAKKGRPVVRSVDCPVDCPVDDPVDLADLFDLDDLVGVVDTTPFPMLHKSAEEKIIYLRMLCMDGNYQDMIEALVNSDKVHFFKNQ